MTLAAASSNFGAGEIAWIAIFIVLEIVSIFFSAKIGRKKGYSPWLFGFLGFFFGLIMLVIVAVMPYRGKKRQAAGATAA